MHRNPKRSTRFCVGVTLIFITYKRAALNNKWLYKPVFRCYCNYWIVKYLNPYCIDSDLKANIGSSCFLTFPYHEWLASSELLPCSLLHVDWKYCVTTTIKNDFLEVLALKSQNRVASSSEHRRTLKKLAAKASDQFTKYLD